MTTGDKVTKANMCGAHFSDIEVAHKVRMLMRKDLDHEPVCTMSRDRIMYLSQQLKLTREALKYFLPWRISPNEATEYREAILGLKELANDKP